MFLVNKFPIFVFSLWLPKTKRLPDSIEGFEGDVVLFSASLKGSSSIKYERKKITEERPRWTREQFKCELTHVYHGYHKRFGLINLGQHPSILCK